MASPERGWLNEWQESHEDGSDSRQEKPEATRPEERQVMPEPPKRPEKKGPDQQDLFDHHPLPD